MSSIIPVVLSGGSGTRLWPLSTSERPKQFVPLLGETSLFSETLRRMRGLGDIGKTIVVTGAAYKDLARQAAAGSGMDVTTIVEPTGRNTAPAAIAAALSVESDDTLVIVPSDHVISDLPAFTRAVASCADLAAQGHIVALGVIPKSPETGYGYIELGEPVGAGYLITSFVEKPSAPEATRLVSGGNHVWNAGMFVTKAGHLIAETDAHTPGLVDGVRTAMTDEKSGVVELAPSFVEVESISIDYAVMEKTSSGAVVPLDAGWSDVGSYSSLLEALEKDGDGNSLTGEVVALNVSNTFVRATSREVVVAGVDGLAIVETPERVLVIGLDSSQTVRELADGN